jgi:single-strand DNA-binding protein
MSQNSTYIGELVKDVDLKYSEKGTAYGWIRLKITRSYKRDSEKEAKVDWLQFTMFGKQVENLAQESEPGDVIEIHGRAESFKRDRPDGTKEYGIQLIVERAWNHTRREKQEAKSEPE